ncbi:hypothetical protein SDC9_146613 [bioreactor metagenome]|uniref:Uncharacterized protein n=1 Tax=bioreactor metagenome TaxID=1076179 RepID=A0A645EFQ0_9ZZZZ
MGVPDGNQFAGGGQHQGIGSLDAVHGRINGLLNGGLPEPFLHDDIGDDLRVGGGLKNGTLGLQLLPQLVGIGEVAVVGQGHAALVVIYQNGLDISFVIAAGGAVAYVAHGDVALPQRLKMLRREHVAHQSHVPIGGEHAVVVHHDAAALLPPMLQSVQRIIAQGGHVLRLFAKYPENAAFLMEMAGRDPNTFSSRHGLSFSS